MYRRLKLCVLLGILCPALVAPATGAPFFDFYGYSYSDGDPIAAGTTTVVATRFNTIQPEPALPFDFAQYEVTAVIEELYAVSIEEHPPVRTVRYDHGEIRIYQDVAKNSAWGMNPPNSEAPHSFEDGELILVGYFTDCMLVFNTTGGFGTVQGHVTFTGGSRLAALPHAEGWLFFGGTTSSPLGGLPGGYGLAWDPQLIAQAPVPARKTSWGAVRAMYR